MTITDDALRLVISEYTREAGVRNLERQIGTIARKIAARVATGAAPLDTVVEPDEIEPYLGPARFKQEIAFRTSRPASRPASRGPRPAATCCSSRRACCPAGTGSSSSPASSAR